MLGNVILFILFLLSLFVYVYHACFKCFISSVKWSLIREGSGMLFAVDEYLAIKDERRMI